MQQNRHDESGGFHDFSANLMVFIILEGNLVSKPFLGSSRITNIYLSETAVTTFDLDGTHILSKHTFQSRQSKSITVPLPFAQSLNIYNVNVYCMFSVF